MTDRFFFKPVTFNGEINQMTTPWAIKPIVPEEVYTDRKDFLDYFL
jgi:hypothetical protein